MDWTQVIGLAAGVCTATSLIPQVVKTIKEKKAEDVAGFRNRNYFMDCLWNKEKRSADYCDQCFFTIGQYYHGNTWNQVQKNASILRLNY